MVFVADTGECYLVTKCVFEGRVNKSDSFIIYTSKNTQVPHKQVVISVF